MKVFFIHTEENPILPCSCLLLYEPLLLVCVLISFVYVFVCDWLCIWLWSLLIGLASGRCILQARGKPSNYEGLKLWTNLLPFGHKCLLNSLNVNTILNTVNDHKVKKVCLFTSLRNEQELGEGEGGTQEDRLVQFQTAGQYSDWYTGQDHQLSLHWKSHDTISLKED